MGARSLSYKGGGDETPLMSDWDRIVERESLGNPLLFRPPAIGPAEAPPAPAEYAQANPLMVAPPRPMSQMPVEQQIAWQEYQTEREKSLLDKNIKARQEETELLTMSHGNELLNRLGDLDPKSEDYNVQRTKLLQQYPYAMRNQGAISQLGVYDEMNKNLRELGEAETTRKQEVERQLDATRLNQAYTLAAKDPQRLAEFNAVVGKDPQAAIARVAELTADDERKNTIAQLRDLGFSDEVISRQFTTPEGQFLTEAAKKKVERETKTQEKISSEQGKAVETYRDLAKARQAAYYDPKSATPNPDWTPEDESIFTAAKAKAASFYPQVATTAAPGTTPAPTAGPSPTPSRTLAPAPVRARQASTYPEGYRHTTGDGRIFQVLNGKWLQMK